MRRGGLGVSTHQAGQWERCCLCLVIITYSKLKAVLCSCPLQSHRFICHQRPPQRCGAYLVAVVSTIHAHTQRLLLRCQCSVTLYLGATSAASTLVGY